MTANKSTPNAPKSPVSNVKTELTLRWRWFKSLHEQVLVASFASNALENNPHFIEIDEIEFHHLEKELQS